MTTIRTAIAPTPPAYLDRELRSAVAGMSRHLRGVPKNVRAIVYDITRTEKRAKPFGRYPEIALAVLRSGAPVSDALKPLDELRAWLRTFMQVPHCLATALQAHTKESGEAQNAAMTLQRVADKPTLAALDKWITEAEEAKHALENAIDCARKLRDGMQK